MQIVIDERQESIESGLVSVAPCVKQLRDLESWGIHEAILRDLAFRVG
jgi:hypothetical protein